MAAIPSIVDSLVEFYTSDQIRANWQKVFSARMARVTEPIHITGITSGGRSHAAIVLNTPQEMDDFIEASQAALKQLANDTSTPAGQLGSSPTFGMKILEV